MKVIVTGANGQLGKSLRITKPQDFSIIKCSRKELDLSNKNDCRKFIFEHNPDWVINCAAYTNVEKAEEEKELAFKINEEAPKAFGEALRDIGGKIAHISTDYVFDGCKNYPYTTSDKKNPINAYGESKAAGEEALANVFKDKNSFTIIRTSWLIGPYGNNFANKILKLNSEKTNLDIISDQISSPTNSLDLSFAIWEILKKFSIKKINYDLPEIIHFSNKGIASWFDLAKEIIEISYSNRIINKKVKLNPIGSKNFKTLARRPAYSKLDCEETYNLLNSHPPRWQDSIKAYLKYPYKF